MVSSKTSFSSGKKEGRGSCLSVSVEHTGPRCCLGHLPNQFRGDHQNPLPDGQCYGRSIVRVEGLVSAKI